MSFENATKNLKFDKRMIDWNLNNNQISQEDLKKHLETLPDLANNVDLIKFNEEEEQETH